MAPVKRKSGGESQPSKRPKLLDAAEKSKSTGPREKPTKPTAAPTVAKLKDEEPMFPRGGGSVLTPLEHKQISIQARNDVLFEQETGKGEETKAAKTRRKPKTASRSANTPAKPTEEDGVRIESLNYTRLVKGSLVLCQVSAVTPLEVQVALPNNLTGHIAITEISEMLTKKLERVAAEDADDDDSNAEDEDDPHLATIFSTGDYLRACVLSTVEENDSTSGKGRKRIELTLKPMQTNAGMQVGDLVANCTVMACVTSVEDHGYVMDVGVADAQGFMAKKEVGPLNLDRTNPGAVFLCTVTSKSGSGKVVQLSCLPEKLGAIDKLPSRATTINTFLPGTVADVLITDVSHRGIVGKVMGQLDVTADLIHSGAGSTKSDLSKKYKVGGHVKGRLICTFPAADEPKLGFSLLPHVLSLSAQQAKDGATRKPPLEILPSSSLVQKCTVTGMQPDIGLFVDVGVAKVPGYVHISRVKDGKIDALYEHSGPFKLGSEHPGRVLGYNAMDGLFLLSLQQSVIDQPYLRIEDIPVGEKVQVVVERILVGGEGVTGIIVQLTDTISGLVQEMHLADVKLQHPEKMFSMGKKIAARVLSTDPAKHQLRLTLKKSLLNSDLPIIQSYADATVGQEALCTIVKVLKNGAIVHFFGTMTGFLPVSEMSEAYISDARDHFRAGQVVNVHVLEVDADAKRLVVSCKDPSVFGLEKQMAIKELKLGAVVAGTVTQKTEAEILVDLVGSGLKAQLPIGHLTDGSVKRAELSLKKIRVGQTLQDLVVLEKNEGRHTITVSQKSSLVEASRSGKLLLDLDRAKVGDLVAGFVRNITPGAVFVQFGGLLTALLPKAKIPQDAQKELDFGMRKYQSLLVKITAIDHDNSRLVVAIPNAEIEEIDTPAKETKAATKPGDTTLSSVEDIAIGKIVKVKVVSVKDTQLNVELDGTVQGRIDVSQVFDSLEDILNPKQPLQGFRQQQVLRARVLGIHDAKNHRFLPISHRTTHAVLELSMRPRDLNEGEMPEQLEMDKLRQGQKLLGFVNNVGPDHLWISLSPNVRGRINALEASNDYSKIKDLPASFPIGSAVVVRVLAVDPDTRRLDLSARSEDAPAHLNWDTIKPDLVVPGKVIRANDRSVMVRLSDTLTGVIYHADLADDYDEANPMKYKKNDFGHFYVVSVDHANKKLRLSTRPSRVLNSSLPVKDREITSISQVRSGELIRGFVKNTSDKGLFVHLGGDVVAHVRIADLSDKFLKDWKPHFKPNQLVKGRVLAVDPAQGHVQLSLKESVTKENYVPLLTITDLRVGQVITGKVRKVADFGAFISLDGTANISGLCHRSEMADEPVQDATKLYKEGDVVKVKVLSVEPEKKRVSLGLKPAYFGADDDESESDNDDAMDVDAEDDGGVNLDREAVDDDELDGIADVRITGTDILGEDSYSDANMEDSGVLKATGLDAGGFDWSANAVGLIDFDTDGTPAAKSTRSVGKQHSAQIQVDRTGTLDANGPQTASDYERLLLGQPDASRLWIAYMAFQMQVSELAKAREVAERALKTIGISEEVEKLNVWIAYLNLEVAYGTEESVEDVYNRACQVSDAREVAERLASIYIQSGKYDAADTLFQSLLKKYGSKSLDVWTNYAHFLHVTLAGPERARALLPRAMQAIEGRQNQVSLTVRFAALECRSPNGDAERARTLFENLIAATPKKLDLWDQLVDLEMALYAAAKGGEKGKEDAKADLAPVRAVFERAAKMPKLKARWAKNWFKKWAKWEEENGDEKSRAVVSIRAREWIAAEERRKAERDE